MKMYSPDLQRYENPDSETCATAEFEIGHTLLHDVIMMEARAYTMKYTANKRREEESIKHSLQAKIDEIQDSVDIEDGERLENLKKCLDDLERKEQEESALKLLAKYNIKGERPTKFFCQ